METVYLTRDGFEKQRRDLAQLIKEIRPEATVQLAVARAHGDLSENAEYDAAKEQLADIDRRIAELQQKLSRVQIIDQGDIPTGEVRILSCVTLSNLASGSRIEYTLVDPMQANPSLRLISVKSPIGAGLLGKKVGDEVEIEVPSGKLRLKVEEINKIRGIVSSKAYVGSAALYLVMASLFTGCGGGSSSSPGETWQMTANLTYGIMPRWNPNGDKILFGDDTPGHAGLWIWDLQGDPVHPADSLPPHNWDYRWSPDGSRIAFTAPGAPEDSVSGVWAVDLSSRVATRVFDRGRDVTWADSGSNLFFRVDDYPGGAAGIYEKAVDDVALPRLVIEEGMLPAAAHQGNLLAFTDGTTDAQLYIADISATPPNVQTVSSPGASQWAWSGDGNVLYCVVNNYTAGVIKGVLYKIVGHAPFASDSLGAFIADPAPNRDGSQIAYLRSSGGRWSGVWVRHPTGDEVVISPYGLNPDMHPTANRVAINVTGGGIRVFEQAK